MPSRYERSRGSRMSRAALVGSVVLLSACATPIGQMTEDDFNWSEETVHAGYQEVYRRITNGLRSCDGDGIPAVPIGNLYTDNRTAHIDVFLGSMYGGHTRLPLGMIQIKALSEGATQVRVAGHKTPESAKFRPGAYRRQQWLDWAAGRPNDQHCRQRDKVHDVNSRRIARITFAPARQMHG